MPRTLFLVGFRYPFDLSSVFHFWYVDKTETRDSRAVERHMAGLRHLFISLRWRLILIAVAALIPALFVVGYEEITLRQVRAADVRDAALRYATQASLELERIIRGTEGMLDAIAAAPVVKSLNEPLCSQYLGSIVGRQQQYTAIAVFDISGNSRCRSDGQTSTDSFADRPYFRDAVASKGFVVGEYTVSRFTGKATLPLAMPLEGPDGVVTGVVVAGLDLHWLGTAISQHDLTANGSLTVADRAGTILAREPLPEQFVGTTIPDQFMPLVHGTAPGSVELTSQDGTRRILGYVPDLAPPKGLYVSVGISKDEAFGPIDAATQRAALLAAVGSLISLALAWLLATGLVRGPVQRILATIDARRLGNVEARTELSEGAGDLGTLGAAIDDYLDELQQARQREAQDAEFRRTIAGELDHRIKNVLATVQAIATQTFRKDVPVTDSLESFLARLNARARGQSLLTSSDAVASATIRDALSAEVSLFEAAEGDHFQLSGPEIRLTSRATVALTMAVHELCTNAVKYGALRSPEGKILVD